MTNRTSIERKLSMTLVAVVGLPLFVLGGALCTGMYQFEAMVASMVCLVGGAALAWFQGGGLVAQASSINETLIKLNSGDKSARAEMVTTDELGRAANMLNAFCDNTFKSLNSSGASAIDQQADVEESIEKLVAEMKRIADGDLTIKSDVKSNVTGSIADSVNHMTGQLRSIVQQVQSAAQQVTVSSSQIRESSTAMSQDSDRQALQIGNAHNQLMGMAESVQSVASMTKESMMVAVEARQTAANGLKAVSNTVDGMQRIRDQVQSTSKRIKRFGESSQEIGEIVQMISDIADRTSILALNASIQAAMAGDAGQGFALVAEEMELLAERSTNATKQVSKMIRAIQNETSEVIQDMEESTREVVAGSQLAEQAGVTLYEIDSVSKHLVELIQTSSASALQQSEIANGIAATMAEISQSTKQSVNNSREATRSVETLANMVKQLRGFVSKFKVSDGPALVDQNFVAPVAKTPAQSVLKTPVVSPARVATPAKSAPAQPAPAPVKASSVKNAPVQSGPRPVRSATPATLVQPETKSKNSQSQNRAAAPSSVPRTIVANENQSLGESPAMRQSPATVDQNLLRQIQEVAQQVSATGQQKVETKMRAESDKPTSDAIKSDNK